MIHRIPLCKASELNSCDPEIEIRCNYFTLFARYADSDRNKKQSKIFNL